MAQYTSVRPCDQCFSRQSCCLHILPSTDSSRPLQQRVVPRTVIRLHPSSSLTHLLSTPRNVLALVGKAIGNEPKSSLPYAALWPRFIRAMEDVDESGTLPPPPPVFLVRCRMIWLIMWMREVKPVKATTIELHQRKREIHHRIESSPAELVFTNGYSACIETGMLSFSLPPRCGRIVQLHRHLHPHPQRHWTMWYTNSTTWGQYPQWRDDFPDTVAPYWAPGLFFLLKMIPYCIRQGLSRAKKYHATNQKKPKSNVTTTNQPTVYIQVTTQHKQTHKQQYLVNTFRNGLWRALQR